MNHVSAGSRRNRLPAGATGVGEAAFRMRVRALTRSRPVTELAVSARRAERFPDVDPVGLALAAVDVAMSRQGLPDAVTYDEAVDVLARLSAAAAPDRPAEDHRALAAHVLDGLLNKAEHQAKFSYEVGNWEVAGEVRYHRSVLEFWLLREREDRGTGQLVLHADADAVNALVAGLAFDVADEQAAAELVLRRQIARGEFARAEATAQRNVQLSVQYAEQIDAVLVETRRDIRAASPRWQTEVPQRLHRARRHLEERLAEEDTLLGHLREVIDSAPGATGLPGVPDPDATGADGELDRAAVLAAAGRASRLLEKCRERHLQLMSRVLAAIDVFLEAQQSQAFRPPGSLRVPHLGAEVLRPLLALPTARAEHVGAAFLTALAPSPRAMVRLGDIVESMLAPARVVTVDPPVAEPEGPGEETAPSVPPAVLDAARDTVHATGLPARLSELLTAAARLHPAPGPAENDPRDAADPGDEPAAETAGPVAEDVDDADDGPVDADDGPVDADRVASLVAAAALWLYAPDAAEEAGAAAAFDLFGSAAMAVTDGSPLPTDLPGGPWYGDDLLVAASEDQLLATLTKDDT
jgi:hypothetical protein